MFRITQTKEWIDLIKIRKQLAQFFSYKYSDLTTFGNTVNQTFEAFVFASVISWYRNNNWQVSFKHPKKYYGNVHLKFTTSGKPEDYTYAIAIKGNEEIEIRHNIRIRSAHSDYGYPKASFVVDVGVIKAGSAQNLSTKDPVENENLITFAEAKHFQAYAELIGSFIGMAHEIIPRRLRKYKKIKRMTRHPYPFLFVSGYTYPSAKGVIGTIKNRGYCIEIYDRYSDYLHGLPINRIPLKNAIVNKKNGA